MLYEQKHTPRVVVYKALVWDAEVTENHARRGRKEVLSRDVMIIQGGAAAHRLDGTPSSLRDMRSVIADSRAVFHSPRIECAR
jgi:hypothetical protein